MTEVKGCGGDFKILVHSIKSPESMSPEHSHKTIARSSQTMLIMKTQNVFHTSLYTVKLKV